MHFYLQWHSYLALLSFAFGICQNFVANISTTGIKNYVNEPKNIDMKEFETGFHLVDICSKNNENENNLKLN